MLQLSAAQLVDLERLWSELGLAFPMASPPESDDEVLAAALDAWIAGVVSSEGRMSTASVDELTNVIKGLGAGGRAAAFAQRVVAVVRSAR
ncbi:hypothetical protein [Arthrobacter sp. NEB 688]|uniref:hypothetical protein n=1 Tax=Arthrobacter sp. NEB 688 TaxID=904039 RepID=UPI001563E63F|nr:hypothetical protein [Arthrobacter sp. NEB 688]QKE85141.1 hypothetical protein HL663_15150 [Arthrobacter sp. NEB 688]